jgi:hypothetical protein
LVWSVLARNLSSQSAKLWHSARSARPCTLASRYWVSRHFAVRTFLDAAFRNLVWSVLARNLSSQSANLWHSVRSARPCTFASRNWVSRHLAVRTFLDVAFRKLVWSVLARNLSSQSAKFRHPRQYTRPCTLASRNWVNQHTAKIAVCTAWSYEHVAKSCGVRPRAWQPGLSIQYCFTTLGIPPLYLSIHGHWGAHRT